MPSHIMKRAHKLLRANLNVLEKRQDPSACSNFYISPTMGQVVNSLDPLSVTWNASCLSVSAIDIYLYSPAAANPRIHVWEGVATSRGTYNATLVPSWWNSTSSQSLQVSIVDAGEPPFLSAVPGGPIFNATYTAPSSGSTPPAATSNSGITPVNDLSKAQKSLSAGKKAAGVLLTLLFIGLGIAGYIKYKRYKGQKERKRWTEAVDKRMSTISTDWKSVSVAGANAAIRNSIAVGSRSSAFSFGAIRPSSTFAVESGGDDEKRSISQMRTGVGPRSPGSTNTNSTTERVSRVSFAPDTRISRASAAESRPSTDSRRTRAFHTGFVPPVPSIPDTDSTTVVDDSSDAGSLSPRQSQGPMTLTPDDIRARIAANKRSRSITPSEMSNCDSGSDIDEVMPALRMMRTGNDPLAPDDLLLNQPEPVYPSYVVSPGSHVVSSSVSPGSQQQATSPVMSAIPMEPIPANVMSPDEMLRAYAERKKSLSAIPLSSSSSPGTGGGPINFPQKAVVKKRSVKASLREAGSKSMRVLFNAAPKNSSPPPTATTANTNFNGANANDEDDAYGGVMAAAYGGGRADSQVLSPMEPWDDGNENVVVGTGNAHPFGYHPNAYTGGSPMTIEEEEEEEVEGGGLAGRGAGGGGGAVYYAQ